MLHEASALARSEEVKSWIEGEIARFRGSVSGAGNTVSQELVNTEIERTLTPEMTQLETTLRQIPEPSELPALLPVFHTTSAREFPSIVQAGELRPTFDPVLGGDFVWGTYGVVQLRTRPSTRDWPVVLCFRPDILKSAVRFFVAGRMHAVEVSVALPDTKTTTSAAIKPSVLIHHFYGSNARYQQNLPDSACLVRPDPIPELYHFLQSDLSRRPRSPMPIECVFSSPIRLAENLVWVGAPNVLQRDLADLARKALPKGPEVYVYETHSGARPSEISAVLAQEARRFTISAFRN